MLPAANRPILEYVLDALLDNGIDDIHLVVGYERNRVQSHFGPTYRGREITYHVQRKQLGSGHALSTAAEAVDDDFLVVNGDEVVGADMVESVLAAHEPGRMATLAVVEDEEAAQYGAVRLSGDRIIEFVEKPNHGDFRLRNAGIYAFSPSVFDTVGRTTRGGGELGIPALVKTAMDDDEFVCGVRTDGFRSKATFPWDLLDLTADLLAVGNVGEPELQAGQFVASSASVHDTATLRPPVVVGPDAIVGPGAVVGPDVALGRNATVESNATVERCVLDEDSRVGAGTLLFDSVTGQGAEVGVGVTVPRGPSDVTIDTTVHRGERLGCVLADRAEVGGGATIRPGSLVGPRVTVAPGARVDENVDEATEVYR